jgi:glycerol-3-phosphate dehydrogenase
VNSDPIGIELAGALKNVYAIASGVASGLGFEANTRAGLVTRCLAEMMKIGVAYGADPITFLSLAGVGDLFLTCSSEKSRNFTVGFRLGKGEKLQDILDSLGSVAEGVATTRSYVLRSFFTWVKLTA